MNIKLLISSFIARLVERGRYRQALAEIEAITHGELLDLGADRNALRQKARTSVYGQI